MITAIRPNIQAYQAKAQAFGQRVGFKPSLSLHPDIEVKILAGDPVTIMNLGRRFYGFENKRELSLIFDGILERNPENPVAKALSEHMTAEIKSIQPVPLERIPRGK